MGVDAQLRRLAGSALIAELDVITVLSWTSEGRSIVHESPFATTVQVVPRAAAKRSGRLQITFLDTTSGGTPAARAWAAATSLELGVVHYLSNVDPDADVPLFTAGLQFVATRVAPHQHPEDVDTWLLDVEWKQVA